MILSAYSIDGTPVSEMGSIEINDLGGNPPYVINHDLPDGYIDITSIEQMDIRASGLIGSGYGFMDWKCLQREIQTLILAQTGGDVNTGWDDLSDVEKEIACRYMTATLSPENLSSVFPDADERMSIALEFDRKSRAARIGSPGITQGRLDVLRAYLFIKIGITNTLEVFYDMTKDALFELYTLGIEGTEEDGNLGINDFLLARSGTFYSSDGLKERSYPIVDGSGDTLSDVADALVEIVSNGLY